MPVSVSPAQTDLLAQLDRVAVLDGDAIGLQLDIGRVLVLCLPHVDMFGVPVNLPKARFRGRPPLLRAVPTDILHFAADLSSRRLGLPIVLEEWSGEQNGAMIVSMPTTARPQQRYDHRLRNLVRRTGDVTVATDLGVPRSTARGWLGLRRRSWSVWIWRTSLSSSSDRRS